MVQYSRAVHAAAEILGSAGAALLDSLPNFQGSDNVFDWVITGFESGPRAREEDEDIARHTRDLCRELGIAFWFKQHAGVHPKLLGDKLDGQKYHELPR